MLNKEIFRRFFLSGLFVLVILFFSIRTVSAAPLGIDAIASNISEGVSSWFNDYTSYISNSVKNVSTAYDHYILKPGVVAIEKTNTTFNKIIEKIVPLNQTANVIGADIFNTFKNSFTPTNSPVVGIPILPDRKQTPSNPVIVKPSITATNSVLSSVNLKPSESKISETALASTLRNLLKQKEFVDQLRGPQGLQGSVGPVGPKGDTGTSVTSSSPLQHAYVGVIQPNPSANFAGATLFGATNLSSNNLSTSTANISNLTVSENTTIAGTLSVTGTITISSPFTLGSTSVTSTGTQFNYLASATGTTGTTSTNLVFSTSPTLVTPALGTPSALVGTNISGTAANLTAGTVTTNANLTGHITSIGNAAVLGSFTTAQLNTAISDADVATLAGTEALSGKTLTAPKIVDLGFLADANGNEILVLDTVASAIPYLQVSNNSTGLNPVITGIGEANTGIDFLTTGTGTFRLLGNATQAGELRFFEDTDNGTNYSAFRIGTQSADLTYILPTAYPTTGQVLSSTDAGVMSWATAGGSSQWTTSGSNIYYTTGNVGVGTITPTTFALQLAGDFGPDSAPTTSSHSITSPDAPYPETLTQNLGNHASMKLDSNSYPVISYYDSGITALKLTHCNDVNCLGGDENVNFVDDTASVGTYTSLALDASGYPVISYYDATTLDLKLVHCNDANCAGGNETITAVDTIGDVGQYTSLVLDSSGYPIIAYYDVTNLDLKVMHCNDADCAGANETTTSVDTTGDVGQYTFMKLDSSGYPVISYYDVTNTNLKVTHCNDANCAGADETTNSPDTTGTVGQYTSLILDSLGYPVVSYYDVTNTDLKVTHCSDVNCAATTSSTVDAVGIVGQYTSISLDSSGYPVISYEDNTNGDLKLAHCNDANCAGGNETINSIDTPYQDGTYSSLLLDSSGYPIISYFENTNYDLKLIHCSDANCNGINRTINAVDSTDSVGTYDSMRLDSSGYPVISYYDSTNGNLKLQHCNDVNCSGGNETINSVDTTGDVGQYTSLILDSLGYPVISYYDVTNTAIKTVHCDDANCDGDESSRTNSIDSTGTVGLYTSIILDGSGYPVISYYDSTNGNLKVTHCNDVNCAGADETTNNLDTPGDVGQYTDIKLDSSGFPVVSYYDVTNLDLKVSHCSDANCVATTSTAIDSAGNVGKYTSLQLDSSGYPVISYQDVTNADLKLIHCNDVNCAGANETTTLVDSTSTTGLYTALVLDGSGYPTISYQDGTNGNLQLIHCNDANCAGANDLPILVDHLNTTGLYTSVRLDSSGFPVIAYYESVGLDLKVVHCTNNNCSGSVYTTGYMVDGSSGLVGYYNSIKLDSSGYPVISYQDVTNADLKLVHCNDVNCSGGNETINTLDRTGNVGSLTSLALDSSGYPVVSYIDSTNADLKLIHCNDVNCSGENEAINTLDNTGSNGVNTSIQLDSNGYPVISYQDINNDLRLVHCNDANCSGGNETINTLDSTGSVGGYTSLILDSSGYPVISYYDGTNVDLKLIHCNDVNCSGGNETINTLDSTGNVGIYTSLILDSSGYPVISYQDGTNADLKLVHCNDVNCSGGNETINTLDSTGSVGTYISLVLDSSGYPVVSYAGSTSADLKVIHCSDATCSQFTGGSNLGSFTKYFNNIYTAKLFAKNTTITQFDLAESYSVRDSSIEAGDIVIISSDQSRADGAHPYVEKSISPYQNILIGIVSTNPGITLASWGDENDASKRAIALSGRVLVKVTLENGPILVGDYITSSSTAGRGMKATAPGRTVGIALSSFTSEDPTAAGEIEIFVSLGFYVGEILSNAEVADLSKVEDKSIISPFITAVKNSLAKMTGTITAMGDWIFKKITAKSVKTDTLCVGKTCLTENELQALLLNAGVPSATLSEEESDSKEKLKESDPEDKKKETKPEEKQPESLAPKLEVTPTPDIKIEPTSESTVESTPEPVVTPDLEVITPPEGTLVPDDVVPVAEPAQETQPETAITPIEPEQIPEPMP